MKDDHATLAQRNHIRNLIHYSDQLATHTQELRALLSTNLSHQSILHKLGTAQYRKFIELCVQRERLQRAIARDPAVARLARHCPIIRAVAGFTMPAPPPAARETAGDRQIPYAPAAAAAAPTAEPSLTDIWLARELAEQHANDDNAGGAPAPVATERKTSASLFDMDSPPLSARLPVEQAQPQSQQQQEQEQEQHPTNLPTAADYQTTVPIVTVSSQAYLAYLQMRRLYHRLRARVNEIHLYQARAQRLDRGARLLRWDLEDVECQRAAVDRTIRRLQHESMDPEGAEAYQEEDLYA